MKKRNIFYLFLISGMTAINAQSSKVELQNTIDNINAIIRLNPLAYYMPSKQYSAYVKEISATKDGIVRFTDSIPVEELTATKHNKLELVSDCCPRKNSRTLDLFAIKKWDIIFPYAYLKDKNNEVHGRIIGFKKQDLYKLKEYFDKLTALCKREKIMKK